MINVGMNVLWQGLFCRVHATASNGAFVIALPPRYTSGFNPDPAYDPNTGYREFRTVPATELSYADDGDMHRYQGVVTAPAPAPSIGYAAWDPNVRYVGGERVTHMGVNYEARVVGENVWNVNSDPQWTPNYWATL